MSSPIDDNRGSRPRDEPPREREDHRPPPRGRWDDEEDSKSDRRDNRPGFNDRKRDRDGGDRSERKFRGGGKRRKHDESEDSKYDWGRPEDQEEEKPKGPKQEPDFKPSGLLSKDEQTSNSGVELKYMEPPEARVPSARWRLYPFKEGENLEPYKIHIKSCFLFGRDRQVADIPTDHLTCSKQHAVIQFREVSVEDPETGIMKKVVKPYIIDLGSTNGTFLNNVRIPDSRYVELKSKDSLKFGSSSRDFVIINESAVPTQHKPSEPT